MSDRNNVCCQCQHFNASHSCCSQLTLRYSYGRAFLERSFNSPACRTKYKPLAKDREPSAVDENVLA